MPPSLKTLFKKFKINVNEEKKEKKENFIRYNSIFNINQYYM